MQTAEVVVLWTSLAVAFYAYVVYPLLVAIASRFVRDAASAPELDATRSFQWPTVSLLIATRRGENAIVGRLRNASALNYPLERLEILVGCDGEGDLTALLARSFDDPRVKVVQLSEQRGASAVLSSCAAKATGEILVFSDVNTLMRPDALRRLVRHFQRVDVGAVCGKLLPIDPTTGRNLSGWLWKLDASIDGCEARLGAVSRINSGIYAVRKSLYARPAPIDPIDKQAVKPTPKKRYRLVYDETAVAVEETPPTIEAEFRARLRTGTESRRSLQQLWSYLGARPSLGVVLCRLHRRLRLAGPALLLAAFVSNACLSNDPFYLHLLLLHELLYLAATIALVFAMGSSWRRLLRVAAPLAAKCAELSLKAWQAIPGRRRRIALRAQNGTAARHAIR
ncbi:MAG TPA: glycosyltransferase [Planctomycetaceae bacterium]|nr:glycosyltransferase [Planctomycetaceae bacterium]